MSEFNTDALENIDLDSLELASEEISEKEEKEIMGASCTT